MSRSDWWILATLTTCLAVAVLGVSDTKERRYNAARTSSTRQPIDQIDRNRAGLPVFAENYISNPDPKQANETDRRDLAAQEASAVWAFWVVIVSLLGVLVTTLGTILLYQQIRLTRQALDETARASDAMRKANEISAVATRPWLSVKIVSLGPVTSPAAGEFHIEYELLVENTGQTPAITVCANIATEKADAARQISFSTFVIESHRFAGFNARAIAPRETVTLSGRMAINMGSIDYHGLRPNNTLPSLLVGASYQESGLAGSHYTAHLVHPMPAICDANMPISRLNHTQSKGFMGTWTD